MTCWVCGVGTLHLWIGWTGSRGLQNAAVLECRECKKNWGPFLPGTTMEEAVRIARSADGAS